MTVPSLLAKGNMPAMERVLPRCSSTFRCISTASMWTSSPRGTSTCNAAGFDRRCGRLGIPSVSSTCPLTTLPRSAPVSKLGPTNSPWKPAGAGENTDQCYVYHLDDDTHIGEDTAASLAEFIEFDGDRFYLAQGILTFPHELTPSGSAGWPIRSVRRTI